MQIGDGEFDNDMVHVWFFRPYDMISFDVLVSAFFSLPFLMLIIIFKCQLYMPRQSTSKLMMFLYIS
jgi:hypothetical protein